MTRGQLTRPGAMPWYRLLGTLIASLGVLFGTFGSSSAEAAFSDFGIASVSASESTSQAGGHPDVTVGFQLKTDPETGLSFAGLRGLSTKLPAGLTGNPTQFPKCSVSELVGAANFIFSGIQTEECPLDSQVGVVDVTLLGCCTLHEPLYNMATSSDAVARLGFVAYQYPVFVDVRVRSASDYGLTATVDASADILDVEAALTTIWGVPASPIHDPDRLTPLEAAFGCTNACLAGGSRPSNLAPTPFVTNPTSCAPMQVGFAVTSYQLPGQIFTDTASLGETEGCEKVPFDPYLSVAPTSHRAGSPTGLDAELAIPQNEAVGTLATSELRNAAVTLPAEMTIAPGAADGLEACSDSQVGFKEEGPSQCPQAAKIGQATFVSPDLAEPLEGSIYQRTPEPGHLFRIWLVADDLGVHLKIPGEVKADPSTGQLTSIFADTPQLPVEEIELHFKGGARGPLKNPDSCGTFDTEYEFGPWSGNAPVTGITPMTIDEGCSTSGFAPRLDAGTANPVAGSHAPFVANVKREDGEQNVAGLDVSLPPGELANLAGVPTCPGAEAATGDCSADSEVGSVNVAVGSGPLPLWLPQPGRAPTAVYLAGPYKGAPYSLVVEVPAQAGPFDLGTVVTRAGIYIDPETTEVTVKSDPLPQILEGVPIFYRTIHVDVDRPGFALNPTNCKTMSVDATVSSTQGAIATPKSRFQVGSCGDLGFKPKLGLKLEGKTTRGAHPALDATLRMPKHGANIGRAVVALPRSEFLDQGHINTVCTRVQFAAEECPAGAVYGHARAVTPLLDAPLEGPVYLRSSNHELPDLVADLRGQIHVVLDGRIDSINGGIRTTFARVPDAPVSKFKLKMKGGAKGLLVNSTNLCKQVNRASAKLTGQNGKIHDLRPRLRDGCHR